MDSNQKNSNISELIPIGKIVSVYAIKGEFIVKPYQNNIEESALLKTSILHIIAKDARKPLEISILNIKKSKTYKDGVLMLSQEFNVPELLKPYIGCEVAITREQFPKAGQDEFYWVDLIDKKVINTQGQTLGIVKRMMDNSVQSILCIHPKENAILNEEILIPFTSTYIIKVEQDITVDWEIE